MSEHCAFAKWPEVPDGLARRQGGRLLKVLHYRSQQMTTTTTRNASVQQVPDRDADKAMSKKLGGRSSAQKLTELNIPAEVLRQQTRDHRTDARR